MNAEDILQENLDRLEAGDAIDASLATLPQDEADLLRLAAALRSMGAPARAPGRVASQRAALQQAASLRLAEAPSPRPAAEHASKVWKQITARLSGVSRLAWAGLAAGLAVIAAAALLAPRPSPSAPAAAPAGLAAQPPANPATVLPYTQYVPMLGKPLAAPDPASALLSQARGAVEIRSEGGAWTAAQAGQTVRAGQRLRTAQLSNAALLFYDGSQARLGPSSELSIEALDARADGPRVIQLAQVAGESDHDVRPSSAAGARYAVETPSGAGSATGTRFHVRVTGDDVARFNVDEGSVSVTHLSVTVIVVAGQSTTVYAGQPPTQPVFRVTGEGQVTQMGEVWTIGGRDFLVNTSVGPDHSTTEIIGDPRIGDWVRVEGRILPDGSYFADRIVLLRRAAENRFSFTGRVEAMGAEAWTIAGRAVTVTSDTDIEAGILEGSQVEVSGVIDTGGSLRAERIRLISDAGLPFEFTGVVESLADEAWTISGVSVTVDENTEITGDPKVGDVVKVEGHILADGTWLAAEIKRVNADDGKFEFSGVVDSLDPWIVSGIGFETDEHTEIDEGIAIGDRVKVEGRVLGDGTWLATEIERLDDAELQRFEFVGRVTSTDPWIVGGIGLAVDERTRIDDGLQTGDLARASGVILADGTLLAERIARLGDDLGCLDLTAVVIRVEGGRIVLRGGQAIDLAGVAMDGSPRANSVVIVRVCVRHDGSVVVIHIIVIFQPRPPAPPAPPGDNGGTVTICHKPDKKDDGKTLTIPRSALGGHLVHGDSLGACGHHDGDHDEDHEDD